MTSFSRQWHTDSEKQLLKDMRNAPHPKDGKKVHPAITHADTFKPTKPGEGGFDMYAGKGKKGDKAAATDETATE